MQRARDRIRQITARTRLGEPVDEVVHELNRFLRGWGGYFRYGHSARHFSRISAYALARLALLVAKRHNRVRGYGLTVVAYASSDRMGLISLDGTVVSPRANKPWPAKPNAAGEGRR
jgi:Group II intron, maturase-specific domain